MAVTYDNYLKPFEAGTFNVISKFSTKFPPADLIVELARVRQAEPFNKICYITTILVRFATSDMV